MFCTSRETEYHNILKSKHALSVFRWQFPVFQSSVWSHSLYSHIWFHAEWYPRAERRELVWKRLHYHPALSVPLFTAEVNGCSWPAPAKSNVVIIQGRYKKAQWAAPADQQPRCSVHLHHSLFLHRHGRELQQPVGIIWATPVSQLNETLEGLQSSLAEQYMTLTKLHSGSFLLSLQCISLTVRNIPTRRLRHVVIKNTTWQWNAMNPWTDGLQLVNYNYQKPWWPWAGMWCVFKKSCECIPADGCRQQSPGDARFLPDDPHGAFAGSARSESL